MRCSADPKLAQPKTPPDFRLAGFFHARGLSVGPLHVVHALISIYIEL
jgi:hypothetical protein